MTTCGAIAKPQKASNSHFCISLSASKRRHVRKGLLQNLTRQATAPFLYCVHIWKTILAWKTTFEVTPPFRAGGEVCKSPSVWKTALVWKTWQQWMTAVPEVPSSRRDFWLWLLHPRSEERGYHRWRLSGLLIFCFSIKAETRQEVLQQPLVFLKSSLWLS